MSSLTIELIDDKNGKEDRFDIVDELSDSEDGLSDSEEEITSTHFDEKSDPFGALIKTSNTHEIITSDKDPINELGNYIHENCLPVDLVKFSSAVDILSYSVIINSLEAQKYFKRKNLKKLNEFVENIVKSINEFRDCIYGFTYTKRSFDQNDLEKLLEKVYMLFRKYKSKYVEREDNINSNLEIEWSVRKRYIQSIVDQIQKEKDDKSISKRTTGLLMSGISKITKQITQGFSKNLQTITDGSSHCYDKFESSPSPVSDIEEIEDLDYEEDEEGKSKNDGLYNTAKMAATIILCNHVIENYMKTPKP